MYYIAHFSRSTQGCICRLIPSASAVYIFACLEQGSNSRKRLIYYKTDLFFDSIAKAKCASFEDKDTERILQEADYIIVESQSRSIPKILGVGVFPTYDLTLGIKRITPREWSGGKGAFSISILVIFHIAQKGSRPSQLPSVYFTVHHPVNQTTATCSTTFQMP